MPTPQETEAAARATVEAFLGAGAQPDPGALDAALAHVVHDFTGMGTGPGDRYADRAALADALRRERERNPATGTYDVSWMRARALHADAALVEGQVQFSIDVRGATHVVEPRCTAVVERRSVAGGVRWLLTHFHFSLANGRQGKEDTLLDALGKRNRELEAEVARRTAELERALADLRAAQARLVHQETMASLGALTAGIAHEIKNPLNFVNNFAGLSRELTGDLRLALAAGDAAEAEALLDDLAVYAEKIEGHGARADAIVRAMMEHGRGGTGERRPADLNAVVWEYARLAEQEGRQRGGLAVGVALDLDPAVGEAEVVAAEVGRVVVNLVRNALDAVSSRAGWEDGAYAPMVTVSTRRTAGGVEVSVADNGMGMSSAVRTRAFEPFFTTKPPGEGTGLGLSLAHDVVVKGHRGTIGVESEEGQGTVVVVSLPAHGGGMASPS
jgi:signal transduction histidine kinase